MTRSARTAHLFVAAAVLVVSATACGGGDERASQSAATARAQPTAPTGSVPSITTGSAAPSPDSAAPAPTAAPGSGTSQAATPGAERVVPIAAYFVRDEAVAPAARAATSPAVASAAVRALLDGPTADERAAGLTSAVPPGTRLRSLRIEAGVAVVDLTGTFASGGGSASMQLRLAQLVTTLTQFPTVSSVRLWLDGEVATTLGGEGVLVDRELDRSDVEAWLPRVLLDSPAAGATVRSPVRLRGSAAVPGGAFTVEITDWDGRIVAKRGVRSGTDARRDFDVTIPYRVDRAGNGAVIVSWRTPHGGRRGPAVEIPVVVAD
jgi:hypothetical protein